MVVINCQSDQPLYKKADKEMFNYLLTTTKDLAVVRKLAKKYKYPNNQ
jgi:hypothetical protein